MVLPKSSNLNAHLGDCGYSRVQIGILSTIAEIGVPATIDGEAWTHLELSTRKFAAQLDASDRAISQAAEVLSRESWFRCIQVKKGAPMRYFLKIVELLSVDTIDHRVQKMLRNGRHEPKRRLTSSPSAAIAKSESPVILRGPRLTPLVFGREKKRLTAAEYDVVTALIEATIPLAKDQLDIEWPYRVTSNSDSTG